MGRSTVKDLITRGENQNEYNKTGLDTAAKWRDFFNDALNDLADDLFLLEILPVITIVDGQRAYDLPANFLQLYSLVDGGNTPIFKRRAYEERRTNGYFILNKGIVNVIDFGEWNNVGNTYSGLYQRYPAPLIDDASLPEVPTMGENALIYYSIAKSLRNNNLPVQAQEVEMKYEIERKKIRNAVSRMMHGVMS